jgi:hypothetical protein
MIDIKRYNGQEEFKKTLKLLPNVPTNNEMSEKTGMSKGSISNIMNGKIPPSKKLYYMGNTSATSSKSCVEFF